MIEMPSGQERAEPGLFFILSRPRTGSTLLRTMLDAHPNLLVPPESQFIVNLYPRYRHVTFWDDAITERFVEDLLRQHLFETWGIPPGELKQIVLRGGSEQRYETVCRQIYLAYRSIYPKSNILLIGDKNPGYALHAPLLARIFPEARFVHLVRDYRDNHLSLVNAGFELPLIGFTSAKWRHFFRRIETVAAQHPERFLRVRYEDLVRTPEQELRKLCHFLAVPWHSSMLRHHEKAPELVEAHGGPVFDRLHKGLLQPVSDVGTGRWKAALSPLEIEIADLVVGHEGELAGYRKAAREAPRFLARVVAPASKAHAWAHYALLGIVHKLPYRFRHLVAHKVSAWVEELWRWAFRR